MVASRPATGLRGSGGWREHQVRLVHWDRALNWFLMSAVVATRSWQTRSFGPRAKAVTARSDGGVTFRAVNDSPLGVERPRRGPARRSH